MGGGNEIMGHPVEGEALRGLQDLLVQMFWDFEVAKLARITNGQADRFLVWIRGNSHAVHDLPDRVAGVLCDC